MLEGLGHVIDEVDDSAVCDWSALWSAFIAIWVGATLRFGVIAQERGLGKQDLERLLNPMTLVALLEGEAVYGRRSLQNDE